MPLRMGGTWAMVDVFDADGLLLIAYTVKSDGDDNRIERMAVQQAEEHRLNGRQPFTAKVREGGDGGNVTAAPNQHGTRYACGEPSLPECLSVQS